MKKRIVLLTLCCISLLCIGYPLSKKISSSSKDKTVQIPGRRQAECCLAAFRPPKSVKPCLAFICSPFSVCAISHFQLGPVFNDCLRTAMPICLVQFQNALFVDHHIDYIANLEHHRRIKQNINI